MIIFVFLGIIASIFQLVILREFTFSIAKNEIAFLAACGLWLVSCALGSIFRDRRRERSWLVCWLSLVFSLCIMVTHLAKSALGLKYYEVSSLGFVVASGLVAILPVSFLIGYSFAYFVRQKLIEDEKDEKIYAKFFAFEAVGFFIGGVTFTFFFSDYSNPFVFSMAPLLLTMAIKNQARRLYSIAIVIILTTAFALSFNFILTKEFSGDKILRNSGSPYGPLVITDKDNVQSIFTSGSLVYTSEDQAGNEEFIHMSLSAVDPAKEADILFVGACFRSLQVEIAKHNVKSLNCVQINPLLSEIVGNTIISGLENKMNLRTDDPRLYLKRSGKNYDAVLLDMPPPSNIALNRYYTIEFFREVKAHLNAGGIFAFRIPGKREILSPWIAKFDSIIINSLETVFKNSIIIPGDSMLIIATDSKELKGSYLLENFRKMNIPTDFFTIYHFQDYLDPYAREYTQSRIDKKVGTNLDLKPFGFLYYLLLEQIKFWPQFNIDVEKVRRMITMMAGAVVILIIILGFVSKRLSYIFNVGIAGFSSIGMSSIIFILFQVYSGALFWKLGFLVAMFMAGLSIGTWGLSLILERFDFRKIFVSCLYTLWGVFIFLLYTSLNKVGAGLIADIMFYLASLSGGLITGAGYPLFVKNVLCGGGRKENTTILIYAADLSGSFFGTITLSIMLLPFLGICPSLLALLLLNIAFALKNLID